MVSGRELLQLLSGEAENERRKIAGRNLAAGLILGGILGVTAGILFAPRSGRETRQEIADRTAEGIDRLRDRVSDYVAETKEMLETGVDED